MSALNLVRPPNKRNNVFIDVVHNCVKYRNIKNIEVFRFFFFEELMIPKIAFEIYWPLATIMYDLTTAELSWAFAETIDAFFLVIYVTRN